MRIERTGQSNGWLWSMEAGAEPPVKPVGRNAR